MDEKESVIVPNDRPGSYNLLNEKGNLVVRNDFHLIPRNKKKFIVKHDYGNIIDPSEATSRKSVVAPKTYIPLNIVAPSDRRKSGHITRKPKR